MAILVDGFSVSCENFSARCHRAENYSLDIGRKVLPYASVIARWLAARPHLLLHRQRMFLAYRRDMGQIYLTRYPFGSSLG